MKCARSVPSTTLDAHTQRHTHTQTHTQTRACIRTEPNRTTPSTRLDAPDRRLPLVRVTPTSRKASVQKSTPTRSPRQTFFWIASRPTTFFLASRPFDPCPSPPYHNRESRKYRIRYVACTNEKSARSETCGGRGVVSNREVSVRSDSFRFEK